MFMADHKKLTSPLLELSMLEDRKYQRLEKKLKCNLASIQIKNLSGKVIQNLLKRAIVI